LDAGDFANDSDERIYDGTPALTIPGERDEGGLSVGDVDVAHVCARIVARDWRRDQAYAAAGGDEREDLLHAGGLGGDTAGEFVSLLFGQPSRRRPRIADRRVGDEALIA
jgi:hypothetical protein